MFSFKEYSSHPQFFLLAGPCVIEGEEMALDIAEQCVRITSELGIPYVFKGSYRKANRSRIDWLSRFLQKSATPSVSLS